MVWNKNALVICALLYYNKDMMFSYDAEVANAACARGVLETLPQKWMLSCWEQSEMQSKHPLTSLDS